MTGFSDLLRDRAAGIWEKEHQHPFIVELGEGALPLEKFQWYMRQDYVFLVEFSRVIALAVAKADTLEDMGWFARLLHETLNAEMALHVSFCEDFGISESELLETRLSPTTLAYTNHMLANAHSGTIGEIAATLLPCSWGYAEIGQALEARGKPADHPLYCRWIEMLQLARVRRARRVAPLVHGPDRVGSLQAAAGTPRRDIRVEQQVRVPVLERRIQDGRVAGIAAADVERTA